MDRPPIYCDHAATSFPKPGAVASAIQSALTTASGSPGRSAHRWSLAASRLVFEARENLAELFGESDSSRIVFSANVTMALNMALAGLLKPGDHVLTTGLEHNAVARPLNDMARRLDLEVDVVPVGSSGQVDPLEFSRRLRRNTRLAVVIHASNVTGAIQPVAEIKKALDGTPLLVDAAQSAGALPLDPARDMADIVAFTGHKGLLGPTGTGGLWIGKGMDIDPLIRGGTGSRSELEEQPEFLPDALEAGTPNTHGLAGLAAGVRFVLDTGLEAIRKHETTLTHRFLDGLSGLRGVSLYGPSLAGQRTAVVSINLEGWSCSDLARVLDSDYGIMTRSGLHCAPRAHRTLGTYPVGTVRFSFGWFNTLGEVDLVLEALKRLTA